MIRMRWFGIALALAVAGCATLRPGGGDPGRSLDAGLRALAVGDYVTARSHLDRAGLDPNGGDAGRRALLLGTLAQLDPRNPDRDFGVAAQRAAALRRDAADVSWTGMAGEVLVELSAELSGTRARIRRADQDRHAAVTAAILARAAFDARVAVLTGQRDFARRQAAELEDTLAARDKELKEKTQELERIRRTIRR